MIYVYGCVMVAYKLKEVHEVVGIQLVGVRLIGTMNRQQRKRHLSKQVAAFQRYIGISKLRQV